MGERHEAKIRGEGCMGGGTNVEMTCPTAVNHCDSPQTDRRQRRWNEQAAREGYRGSLK